MSRASADLFPDTLPTPPTARRKDPATSKMAAIENERGARANDKATLLRIIRNNPGKTSSELAEILVAQGVPMQKAIRMPSRRASDLIKDRKIYTGVARPCAVTGRKARPYFPIKAGI